MPADGLPTPTWTLAAWDDDSCWQDQDKKTFKPRPPYSMMRFASRLMASASLSHGEKASLGIGRGALIN
jgi:hypothetical protein